MEERAAHLRPVRALWGAAALTVAGAVMAVLAVREVAVHVLHPNPAFTPLSLGSPIIATVVCTAIAIYVFVGLGSYSNPLRTWRRASTVVLILSLAPCLLLGISHLMGGAWPEAFALMAMHIAVWAICVTLLPWLALTKNPANSQIADRPLSIL
jgi:hypothetical protein